MTLVLFALLVGVMGGVLGTIVVMNKRKRYGYEVIV